MTVTLSKLYSNPILLYSNPTQVYTWQNVTLADVLARQGTKHIGLVQEVAARAAI